MTQRNKNVLMIAYSFPPIAGAGVYRSLKFIKYLRQFGWTPIVICARNSFSNPKDESLEEEIPEGIEIRRVLSGENPLWSFGPAALRLNDKWVHIPDSILLWKTFAYHRAKEIIRRNKIDVLYSSSPPETTLLLGLKLKEKFRIPWVIDYRDPWTERCTYPTLFHKQYEEKLEKKIADRADHIVLNTEVNRINYISRFEVSPEKCTTIMNGFDPADFKNLSANSRNDKLILTYSGIFRKSYAPESFLLALLELARRDKNFAKNVIFCKTGVNRWPYYKKIMSEIGKEMEVKEAGHIAYNESLEMLQESDLLVLTLPSDNPESNLHYDDDRDVNGWVPSKVYNYLAARKRILAIVPEQSIVAKIVSETNTGSVVAPDDHAGIVKTLREAFERWQHNNVDYSPNVIALDSYSRVKQTEKLASIFDKLSLVGHF